MADGGELMTSLGEGVLVPPADRVAFDGSGCFEFSQPVGEKICRDSRELIEQLPKTSRPGFEVADE